jgi:hypothetical protein
METQKLSINFFGSKSRYFGSFVISVDAAQHDAKNPRLMESSSRGTERVYGEFGEDTGEFKK